jgi:hypothetical protein
MLTLLLGLTCQLALAHRGHQTLSVVEIDVQGRVTVTHRLSAHETEPELVLLAPNAQPSLDDPDALKALEDHLATAFKVNGADATLVSHTFQADDVILVYSSSAKFAKAAGPQTVIIDFQLFPASLANSVGLVNVRYQGVTKSLRFMRGDAAQTVSF